MSATRTFRGSSSHQRETKRGASWFDIVHTGWACAGSDAKGQRLKALGADHIINPHTLAATKLSDLIAGVVAEEMGSPGSMVEPVNATALGA